MDISIFAPRCAASNCCSRFNGRRALSILEKMGDFMMQVYISKNVLFLIELLSSGRGHPTLNCKTRTAMVTICNRRGIFLAVLVYMATTAWYEEAAKVRVCQLKADPPAYNHKLIEVTGFVSHAFEDFSLFDPACSSWPPGWLEYGGKTQSGTMYCCGVSASRSRPDELKVEDIRIPLIVNREFEDFDKAVQPPFRSGRHGAIVRATLVGRFFAGRQIEMFKGHPWGGYGHMGCCTLLAIQEVKAVDSENRADLDYGASPDQPEITKRGCGYRDLLPIERQPALMQWQRDTDEGVHEWALDDPRRVASDTLSTLENIDVTLLTTLRLTRETQGRKVYEWRAADRPATYMVVVSRPYWLSFYSRNSKRVAWAPLAAYKSSCDGKNSVTRIK